MFGEKCYDHMNAPRIKSAFIIAMLDFWIRWKFSFHEIATIDLPAFIDYTLKYTRRVIQLNFVFFFFLNKVNHETMPKDFPRVNSHDCNEVCTNTTVTRTFEVILIDVLI